MWRTINRLFDERILAIGLVCFALAGCDYSVPLVETPSMPRDDAVFGSWEKRLVNGELQRLLILPMDDRGYFVVFPAKSKNAMFARGSLWSGPWGKWVQLDWFGTEDGEIPDNDLTYQFAMYSVDDDKLIIQLLNPNIVSGKIKSASEIEKSIVENRHHPKLFREAMVFRKVKK